MSQTAQQPNLRRNQRRTAPFAPILMLTATAAVAVWGGVSLRGHHTAWIARSPLAMVQTVIAPAPTVVSPMSDTWSDDSADLPNPQKPVEVQHLLKRGVSFILIDGGVAGSRRSETRHGVEDFVKTAGATAGLNGTFFANASLEGTDNMLIGPSLCGDETQAVIGPFDKRPALEGRPLVMLSPSRTKIVPYDLKSMDDDVAMRYEMPDVSDAFLGGVWLVHNGAPADADRIATFHVHDANDCRRRAFFAVLADGRPALGATDVSVSSKQLAIGLAAAGIREAVLVDSGFSTSLVYGNQILVSGHSSKGIPSRPVPHAVLLFDNITTAETAPSPTSPEPTDRHDRS